jgi:hypothetical protein
MRDGSCFSVDTPKLLRQFHLKNSHRLTNRRQYFCHLFQIDSTVVGHIFLASFVDIQRAHFALEPLSEQSVQQRPAMVTKCEPLVVVDHETVRDVHAESGALLTSLECCVIKLSQIGPVKASPHLSFLDILLKLESDTFCERRKCTLQQFLESFQLVIVLWSSVKGENLQTPKKAIKIAMPEGCCKLKIKTKSIDASFHIYTTSVLTAPTTVGLSKTCRYL